MPLIETPRYFWSRCQYVPWPLEFTSLAKVSAVAAVLSRPNICNRTVLLTSVAKVDGMDEKERGRKTPNSSNGSEGLERRDSGLHSRDPTFPDLLRFPAYFPSLLQRPRGRTAATPPGLGLRPRSSKPGAEGAQLGDAPPRAGRRRGWKRSQSAGEAMAGPRLAGPAASNLRCPSRLSFEPLHPLVALSLLQARGPPRWPGRTGVRRKKTQVPPSVPPAQSVR